MSVPVSQCQPVSSLRGVQPPRGEEGAEEDLGGASGGGADQLPCWLAQDTGLLHVAERIAHCTLSMSHCHCSLSLLETNII